MPATTSTSTLSEPGFSTSNSARWGSSGAGGNGAPGEGRGIGITPTDISALPGRLIVVEGTDGVGRSTQVALLREWLENRGFGVAHTALTRSRLAGEGLRKAKEGHTLGRLTMDLYYATDLADRIENQVIPALRAGFVVLTDRYIYSVMARSIVRGVDPGWIRDVYRFAPSPHAVFYLKCDMEHLAPRVLAAGGFDYWESGMDFQEENDVYQSFVRYQGRLLSVFDHLAAQYHFNVIDGNRDVDDVFADLSQGVLGVVGTMSGAKKA
jgi:dTMP kinase